MVFFSLNMAKEISNSDTVHVNGKGAGIVGGGSFVNKRKIDATGKLVDGMDNGGVIKNKKRINNTNNNSNSTNNINNNNARRPGENNSQPLQTQPHQQQNHRRRGNGFNTTNNNNINNNDEVGGSRARQLRVAGASNAKAVAGSIAYSVREGICPEVLAVGDASVNQAVKAVAIARSYLKNDGIDICFQPEMRNDSQFAFAVALVIHESVLRTDGQDKFVQSNSEDVKVANTSNPTTVAGSIAGRVRDHKRVTVGCIGATSVSLGIKSLIYTREFLRNDCKDISCKPEFSVTMMSGDPRTAVKMTLLSSQI